MYFTFVCFPFLLLSSSLPNSVLLSSFLLLLLHSSINCFLSGTSLGHLPLPCYSSLFLCTLPVKSLPSISSLAPYLSLCPLSVTPPSFFSSSSLPIPIVTEGFRRAMLFTVNHQPRIDPPFYHPLRPAGVFVRPRLKGMGGWEAREGVVVVGVEGGGLWGERREDLGDGREG